MIDKPFKKDFVVIEWLHDDKALNQWQTGHTGFPIVDAGMRQLWRSGWMHNRVRMIVASFLTRNLLTDWHVGESWFWDTLLDADLANNIASWQWVTGCGSNTASYFRVFNPSLQSKKFDAEGHYIRQWVPELKDLPDEHIHEPHKAPQIYLDKAAIILGKTYPYPMVDHLKVRQRAMQHYKIIETAIDKE